MAKVNKKIVEFRIGQLIYNPQFINKGAIAVIDRPFAGYLLGRQRKASFQNESVLKVGLNWVSWGQLFWRRNSKTIP
jgi:hypothetical protein